ncbi:MAG: hypothetical protein LBB59_00250 [Campylobacteraceae bacterium]|nr:hypothetical protein [Campylobacteraceae bacterium]
MVHVFRAATIEGRLFYPQNENLTYQRAKSKANTCTLLRKLAWSGNPHLVIASAAAIHHKA